MAEGEQTDGDALRRLQERLDRAALAAERLLSDAAAAAASSSRESEPARGEGGTARGQGEPAHGEAGHADDPPPIPPAGWQRRAADGEAARSSEIELLLGVIEAVRDRIPPELQRRLADAVRELLLALRALIDWYLERSERRRAQPADVQDIPIL